MMERKLRNVKKIKQSVYFIYLFKSILYKSIDKIPNFIEKENAFNSSFSQK